MKVILLLFLIDNVFPISLALRVCPFVLSGATIAYVIDALLEGPLLNI